mmetsp:Transcript_42203/g.50638  ORF Transcript_42203/g.50638 Transcript_42203/m.50638 type:complete len:80 (-) Transcript_42203:983-1222(-)
MQKGLFVVLQYNTSTAIIIPSQKYPPHLVSLSQFVEETLSTPAAAGLVSSVSSNSTPMICTCQRHHYPKVVFSTALTQE